MWLAEQVLFQLARSLYKTEVAHTSEMKSALKNINAYDAYRAAEIHRIIKVLTTYRISISGRTIVDFGCSDGAISAEYLRSGAARVIGVDIDERALERARVMMQHEDRVTFIQNTVNSIPLSDESADIVISYDVFEHVSQPAEILKEIYRILSPGGKAVIGTWSWWHPFAPHLWSTMPVPWAHVFFSEKTVLRVCRRVYQSSWYKPTMHDYDQKGDRIPDKYTNEAISTDYLNKWLIRDFERTVLASGFILATHPVPFGSRYARWTRFFLRFPWFRELLSGYVWFVLTKPPGQDKPPTLG